MSAPRNAVEQLELLIDAYLTDLQEMSPHEVLEEPGDQMAEQKLFESMLEKAKAEAGRRRLLRARATLAENALLSNGCHQEPVEIEVARKYIAAAANDKRFTLAARDLGELPDEEIIRIYLQLRFLESNEREDR